MLPLGRPVPPCDDDATPAGVPPVVEDDMFPLFTLANNPAEEEDAVVADVVVLAAIALFALKARCCCCSEFMEVPPTCAAATPGCTTAADELPGAPAAPTETV